MITRYYMIVLLAFGVSYLHGQNKTVINVGEGAGGSGAVSGQDSIKVAILQHQESNDVTAGLTDTTRWVSRKINTEVTDQIGVSIVGDTSFTLPSGSYLINYMTQLRMLPSTGSYSAVTRIYNLSTSTEVVKGEAMTHNISMPQNLSGSGFVSIGSTATFSIQHWIEFENPAIGSPEAYQGQRSNFADTGNEIYATITIIKLQ